MEELNFMIFNISEVNKIDFTQVAESNQNFLRLSVDSQKSFVKWRGTMPPCLDTLSYKDGPYVYEDFLVILSGPEWTGPNPMPN